MSNIFSGSGAQSQQSNEIFGLQVQTSIYGSVIPFPYGTVRGAGNIIWNGDWQANPVSSGGKGSKSSAGGKYGNGQQYNYQTAIAIAIGMGRLNRLLRIWQDKTQLSVQQSSESFTVPTTPFQITPIFASTIIADSAVNALRSYSHTVTDYGAPGPITLAGTGPVGFQRVSSSPGPGQYSVSGAGVYTFNAADAGQQVQIDYYFYQSTPSIGGAPALTLNLTLFEGVLGQSPWSYLVSNHGTQAFGFSEVAYVVNQAMNLGSSGSVSNFGYEMQGNLIYPGQQDCVPTDVIYDLLTNPYQIGGSPSLFSIQQEVIDYCLANNIFISSYMDSQQPGTQWLDNLCKIANCAPILSDGIMKFRSYGDSSAFNNGVLFTPPTQPVVDLTDDDFIPQGEFGPIECDRPSVRQAFNSAIVEWTNRGNAYNTEPVEDKDQLAIDKYGYRPAPVFALHEITSQPTAQLVASVLKKFQVYKRIKYSFKLPIRFLYLESMDIVTITDVYLGLNQAPVRILTVSEDEKKILTIECEEFPWSIGTPTLYQRAPVGAIAPGYYAPPGSVWPPQFSDLSVDSLLLPNTLGIALSGGPDWGGAQVFVSRDGGVSYGDPVGTQFGSATMGRLTAILPYGADPDAVHTLSVDLSQSESQLASVSQEDYDAFDSLVAVDRELLAYKDSTLTAFSNYDLTNLHRGVYGSQVTRHEIGAQFCAVDSQLFQFQYLPGDIGNTLYFKFCSFNKAGQQLQNISLVIAYAVTIFAQQSRAPMPWKPDNESAGLTSGDLVMNLTQDADNVSLDVFGRPISNVVAQDITPPVIDYNAIISAASGSIAAGSYVGTVVGFDSAGDPSDISNLTNIKITSIGQIATVAVAWSPNTVAYQLFIGIDFNGLRNAGNKVTPGSMPATIAFTQGGFNYSPPDISASRFHVRAKRVINGGIFDDNVLSIPDSSHIKLGQALLTGGTLAGRNVTLISRAGLPATQNYHTFPIVNNTTDTLQVTAPEASQFNPGDLVLVNYLADSFSGVTIGDSLAANGYFPGGFANPLNGKIVRITNGTGVGQWRYIGSNTTTVLTITVPWTITPDATTSFIIEESSWRVDTVTSDFQNMIPPGSAVTKIAGMDLTNLTGFLALVEVLPQSASGVDADETETELRQLYIQHTNQQSMGVTVDGGGSPPATGSKGYLTVPYDCTIDSWAIVADQSGSMQATIKMCTPGAFPTTVSIVASAPPAISGAQNAASGTLPGWTISLPAGNILEFNLDSVTSITRFTLQLIVTKVSLSNA